jgi:hypothetical protein
MAKITVIDADGNPAEINEENFGVAQQRGARLPTPEEQQEFADKKQYGEGLGNELKAGLAGAARGATFGLSDVIGADLGKREALLKLQEQNPVASTVGEIAGAVAPAALSGGAGAVGTGARIAGTGVRAAEAAGAVAERGVAGLAKALGVTEESGLLARAIATGTEKAAGGAVQGVLYGGGQAISEAALSDKDLTAEQIVQHLGASALLGGAVGGAFGAGGKLAGGAAKAAVNAAANSTKRVAETFRSVMGAAKSEAIAGVEGASNSLVDKIADKLSNFSATLSGASKQDIEFFLKNPEAIKIAESGDDAIMKAADRIAPIENERETLLEKLTDRGRGAAKQNELRNMMRGENPQLALETSADVVTGIKARLDDMLERAKQGEFEVGTVNKARKRLDGLLSRMDKPGPNEHAKADLFIGLDDFKRDLQKVAKSAQKSAATSTAARDTFEAMNEMQRQMLTHLENSEVWGELASGAQRDVNKAWTRFLQNEQYEGAKFHKVVRGDSDFGSVYENDPGAWMGFFKREGTPAATLDRNYIAERMQANRELAASMQRHFATDAGAAKDLERLNHLTAESERIIKETADVSRLQNRFKALDGSGGISGTAPGSIAGFMAAGPAGAVVGGFTGSMLSRPAQSLRTLSQIQGFRERIGSMNSVAGAVKGATDRISKAVDGFIGKAKKGAATAAGFAPVGATIVDKPGVTYLRRPKKGEDEQELHRNRVNELLAFKQNPQLAVDRLTRSTEQLAQSHPQVSQAVQMKAMQVASFLLSKAPPTIQTQADLISGKTRPIAKTDLATFNRYVEAASDPGSVLDSLERGHVSVEAAETMRALYPKTVEQLRAKLIDGLGKGAELSHKQRLVLSQFFDTPFSSTLEPSFLATCQANWNSGAVHAATQQAQNPQQGARMPGIAKAKFGTDDQTKSERLAG